MTTTIPVTTLDDVRRAARMQIDAITNDDARLLGQETTLQFLDTVICYAPAEGDDLDAIASIGRLQGVVSVAFEIFGTLRSLGALKLYSPFLSDAVKDVLGMDEIQAAFEKGGA